MLMNDKFLLKKFDELFYLSWIWLRSSSQIYDMKIWDEIRNLVEPIV